MNGTTLLAGVAGAIAGVGVWLVVLGLRPAPPGRPPFARAVVRRVRRLLGWGHRATRTRRSGCSAVSRPVPWRGCCRDG